MDNFEKATLVARLGCPVCGEHSLGIFCPNTTDSIFLGCQNENCELFGNRNPVTSRTQVPAEEDIDKVCELQEIAFAVKMQKKRVEFNSESIRRFKVSKLTKGLIESICRENDFLRKLRAHRFYQKGCEGKQEFVAADPRGNGLVRVTTLNERKKEIARIGYYLYDDRIKLKELCKKINTFRKKRKEAALELEAQIAKLEKEKKVVKKLGAKPIWKKSPWKDILDKAIGSD